MNLFDSERDMLLNKRDSASFKAKTFYSEKAFI